ncbi:unnamed protein product [Polarella glacialis]|uniref:Secreted protein n=1 Tax=Polarella glacialis TaxID=89957 RepID=A0A813D5S9_POLGL|nr:unnamed protein product [Polarella glacialis]
MIAMRILWLALGLGAFASSGCPEQERFQRWMLQFEVKCRSQASIQKVSVQDADPKCDWVTCDCLEVSLQVPVELSQVPTCFEEGVIAGQFSEDQRQIASELIRGSACGERTRVMGMPCSQCDRYRLERPQCSNTTVPPYRTFIPSLGIRALPGVVIPLATAIVGRSV